MKNIRFQFLPVAFVSSLMTLLLFSCGSKEKTHPLPQHSDLVPVKVMALSQTKNSPIINASGLLTTDDETILSFKTGGVIQAVFVKEGDHIKKGQLLSRLDLTEINALVAQANQGYEKALRDFNRVKILYKDSVATLEQLQNSETGLSVAREQRDAAHFNRAFSEIHAPADGYVLHKFVNAGQVVASGSPVLTANAASPGKWIMKAGVSDKQWAAIKLNDKADVHVDALPNQVFSAHVIRKSERSDPQTGSFTIELEVRSKESKLATGMFASAKISSGQATSSWSLPYESVLDANGNEGFVFVTNDKKTALRLPVVIESFSGNSVQVSKGLENAKAIIISGSAYLSDGSSLEIATKPL